MATPVGSRSAGSLFIPPIGCGPVFAEQGPNDPGDEYGLTRSTCIRTSSGAPAGVKTLTLYQGGFSPLQYIRLFTTGPPTNPPCDGPRFGAGIQPSLPSSRSKKAETSSADPAT